MSALSKLDQLLDQLSTSSTFSAQQPADFDCNTAVNTISGCNIPKDGTKYNIFATLHFAPHILDAISDLKKAGHNVTSGAAKLKTDALKDAFLSEHKAILPSIEAVLCSGGDKNLCSPEVLEHMPQLRVIATTSAGFNHIDVGYCNKRKIHVLNVSPSLTNCVADFTVGLMIAAARLFATNAQLLKREGRNLVWDSVMGCGKDLFGSTVGLFGFGAIAQQVCKRLYHGFGCKIIYNSRERKDAQAKEFGADFVSFDELLQRSDFVVALSSLNAETKGIFNEQAFQKMKKDSVFVNVSRGGVCVTDALVKALNNEWIFAAGVDVTDPEPFPSDHELWNCKNVVILPHVGSATFATRKAMCDMAVDNMFRALCGKESNNYVTSWHRQS